MILFNNRIVEFGHFPNGESYLKKIKPDPQGIVNVVTLKYENDEDLFHLLMLKKHLDELKLVTSTLRITYVPYSRMDRDNDSYYFTLQAFTAFINHMNWPEVVIYEPHSDVTPALLHRSRVIDVTASLLDRVAIADYQLYFPDAGAEKRYGAQIPNLAPLIGIKRRDFMTGKILSLEIVGEKQDIDTVVIVDDLCSKGGTFVLAAKELRKMGFKTVALVVAHCEQTIFKGEIFDSRLIDKVITTDSILEIGQKAYQKRLEIIPLTEFK